MAFETHLPCYVDPSLFSRIGQITMLLAEPRIPGVMVVAADPLARTALVSVLDGEPGCTVVGESGFESHLPDSIIDLEPDVILWDLGWSPDPALEALAELETASPVLVLASDDVSLSEVMTSGVVGVLSREADGPALAAAVAAAAAAAAGLMVFAPDLMPDGLAPSVGDVDGLVEDLTPRELGVLSLLAEGLPNKNIADQLDITEHTVKFHVNSILNKLGARSRTEAVVRATRQGLILL